MYVDCNCDEDEPVVDNPAMQSDNRKDITITYQQQAIDKDKAIRRLRQFPKINIEGNIGAGKSTVLAALDLHDLWDCVIEPVAQWQHGHDVNILEKAYHQPKEFAFLLQTLVTTTMKLAAQTPLLKETAVARVYDRSPFSSEVFIRSNPYLTSAEKRVARQHLHHDLMDPLYQPDYIVYLDTSVDTCVNRIRARSRKGEEKLDAPALTCLKTCYDQWIDGVREGTEEPKMCKGIIYVNGDGDHDGVIREVHGKLKQLFPTHPTDEPDTAFNPWTENRNEE